MGLAETQIELAKKMGLDSEHIGYLENGKWELDWEMVADEYK